MRKIRATGQRRWARLAAVDSAKAEYQNGQGEPVPGRRVPDEILPYLGQCRELGTTVEAVLDQVLLTKEFGDGVLSDFDPLVVLMELVAQEVQARPLSPRGPRGGRVWMDAMVELQETRLSSDGRRGQMVEHNRFLPCRTCDRAFRPEVNRELVKVFMSWSASRSAEDLVAIHRCQACGGSLTELETRVYQDDYHTPEPGYEGTDAEWAQRLLRVSGYWEPPLR